MTEKRVQAPDEKLIPAAFTMIERDGWDSRTMLALAKAAKLKVADLYRIAADKPTLLKLIMSALDRDIVARLQREFSAEKLTVYSADALEFDFSVLGKNLRVVGNLPYNISTPILFHLSSFAENINDMHFMLQKEVVARMVAAPSTSAYGRLSVMLQCRFAMEQLFIVAPESFHPAPKVESAVVRLSPLRQALVEPGKEKLFAGVVAAAFSQRRKTLRNTLGGHLKAEDFTALEIDPGLRAENLSVIQFVAITNHLGASNP